jgi:hypothetical protein
MNPVDKPIFLLAIGLLLLNLFQYVQNRAERRKTACLDWAKREMQPLGKRR